MVELDEGFSLPTHFHQYIPFTKEALQHNGDISVLPRMFLLLHMNRCQNERITNPHPTPPPKKKTRISHQTGFMETVKPYSIKTASIYGYMSVCYKTAEP